MCLKYENWISFYLFLDCFRDTDGKKGYYYLIWLSGARKI